MTENDKLKLDNQLCFSLYALSREVIKMYQPVLSKYNLTYTQYVTMLAMWEMEKTPFKELAKKLYLDSGTLTPVLKKLEAMGLVNKYRDKNDDRMVIVELTEKAMDLKKEIVEVPDQMYCKLDGFDKDEMLQLKKSLDKMLKKLGRFPFTTIALPTFSFAISSKLVILPCSKTTCTLLKQLPSLSSIKPKTLLSLIVLIQPATTTSLSA